MKSTLVARVVGRVIAHELGHYLLPTSAHSPTGLMRPWFSPDTLVEPGEAQFDLEPQRRAAVVCRLVRAQ